MNRHGIRPATPDDFRAILTLLDEASLPTQDLGNTRPVHFWVAESDGRIAGAGGLEQYGDAGLLRRVPGNRRVDLQDRLPAEELSGSTGSL